MSNYYLNKVFIEIRYNNSVLFYDMSKIQEIINELNEIYPQYQYDNNQKILILGNPEQHLMCNIGENRIVLDNDEPMNIEKFGEVAQKTIKCITEKLKIIKFNRIGMRILNGLNQKNFNNANSFIKKNFIKLQDKDLENLSNEFLEYGVLFSFKVNNYIVKVRLNPNSLKILEMKNNEVIRQELKTQVLIDVDIFLEGNVDANNIMEHFISDVIHINNCKISDFIKNVGVYYYE